MGRSIGWFFNQKVPQTYNRNLASYTKNSGGSLFFFLVYNMAVVAVILKFSRTLSLKPQSRFQEKVITNTCGIEEQDIGF